MPLGEGVPHERGEKKGHPLKRLFSSVMGSSNVKKWLQISTNMLLIITSTGDELLRNVNIDDLD